MTVLAIGSMSGLGALRNMLVDEFQDSHPAQEKNMFIVELSSSQAAAIFRRLTKTTATCMRESVAIAHRESTSEIQSAISEAMLHSMAVHRESYAAKAHQSTIYKGLKAVGSVQCLQESASYSTNRESTPDVPSSEEQNEIRKYFSD
ncbi:hypothetical protein RRG08_009895 [Elysia crispata]|uniref:Uncharacterized protein n=1 Tax=Elysia crispata TaxID=231223 RepID=A0AAE0Y8B3_9GAST|nr:hypothetical protein RRG08_009895 [Elysia crispata]